MILSHHWSSSCVMIHCDVGNDSIFTGNFTPTCDQSEIVNRNTIFKELIIRNSFINEKIRLITMSKYRNHILSLYALLFSIIIFAKLM